MALQLSAGARVLTALRRCEAPLRSAARALAPARSMGIMDSLRGMADRTSAAAKTKKQEEAFTAQLAFLTSSPTYTLADHVRLLESLADSAGVNGWRMMLLSEAQKAELAEQLVDLKIGAAFTPAEAADPRLICAKAKLRVVTELGTDIARVNRFLDGFAQSAMCHKWLQSRKARGLALPSSVEEYINTMMADRVGMAQNKDSLKKSMGKARNNKSALRSM